MIAYKYIAATLFSAAAASSLIAETITYKGGTGSETARTQMTTASATTDVIWTSDPVYTRTEWFFNGTSKTIKSLTTEAGNYIWNMAYSLTVDANAASGTVSVVDVNGSFKFNYGEFIVKNSASGSTAVLTADFGTAFTINSNGAASANFTLESIKGSFLCDNLVIDNSNLTGNTTFKVSNSNITWANSTSGATAVGTIKSGRKVLFTNSTVALNAALAMQGTMQLSSNSTVTANAASVFSSTSSLIVDTGSTLNFNSVQTFGGTMTFAGAVNSTVAQTLYNLTLTGSYTQTGNTDIAFNGTSVIKSGSSITSGKGIWVNGTLTIESGVSLTFAESSRIVSSNNSRLTLNGTVLQNYSIVTVLGGNSTVFIGSDTTVKGLSINQNNGVNEAFTLDLAGFTMYVDGIAFLTDKTPNFTIKSFENNRFHVSNFGNIYSSAAEILNAVTLLDAEGNEIEGTYVFQDGWLTVVPEPAEWAAIFGAAALAAAIVRRRRK